MRSLTIALLTMAVAGGSPWAAPAVASAPSGPAAGPTGGVRAVANQQDLDREIADLLARAEEMFATAEQAATIPLLDRVVEHLRGLRATGIGTFDDLLVRALSYRAEAAFNLGETEAASADLAEMIRVDPSTDLDRNRASPKLAELFDGLRDEIVGSLVMNVQPPDATVYINGEPVDWAAGVLSLVAGSYAVGVERAGYSFVRQEIDVPAGGVVPLDAALERDSAALTFRLEPADARVTIDGSAATLNPGRPGDPVGPATGTFTVDGLSVGDHVLEVTRDGYRPRRDTVSVGDLTDYRLEPIVLAPTAGTLLLNGLAPGVTVSVDGREVTPDRQGDGSGVLELSPGDYRVDADGGARGSFRAEVSVRDLEETTIDIRLRPTLAYLGVLGGDDMGRDTFEEAAAATFTDTSRWAWRPYVEQASPLLAAAGLDADAARGVGSAGEGLPIGELQERVASELPASAYVLGVLDDDLIATRVDVWIWPAPPGPARADRIAVELDGAGLAERLEAAFAFRGTEQRAWLGALVGDADVAAAPTVFGVTSGGPADTAGVKPGDQIVEAAGQAIDSAAAFDRVLAGAEPGTSLELRLQRGTVRIGALLRLGSSPNVLSPRDDGVVFSLAWLEAETTLAAAEDGESEWVLALNQVAALLHARDWENAVRRLRTIDAPERAGVGAGTAHFWLGLALSELGPDYSDRAREAFERAAAIPGARLLHDDGPLIAPLAAARLAYLSR